MYSIMRGHDREYNLSIYPKLYYPEIYLLSGGYQQFFASFPEYCEGGYVKKNDKDYSEAS